MCNFSKSLNPRNIAKSVSDIRIRIRFSCESSFWISLSGCELTILPDIQPANRIVIISGGKLCKVHAGDDQIVDCYYPILSCFWKMISVSDPNPVLVKIILSVSENYPKVYYDAQHAVLCSVYSALWGKITVISPLAVHDWLQWSQDKIGTHILVCWPWHLKQLNPTCLDNVVRQCCKFFNFENPIPVQTPTTIINPTVISHVFI